MAHQHGEGFLKLTNDAKTRVKEWNVAETKRRMDAGEKFLLVDVREDNEWQRGHIPGAVHMGRGIIERDIEQAVSRLEKWLGRKHARMNPGPALPRARDDCRSGCSGLLVLPPAAQTPRLTN
jgi:Rhodanese-like domain